MKYSTFYSVFPIFCLIFAYQIFLSDIINNPSKIIILVFLMSVMFGWIFLRKKESVIIFLSIFTASIISFCPFFFNYTKDLFSLFTGYIFSGLTLFVLMVTNFSNQVIKL